MTITTPSLYIGNKNYSSWSLRAWLALRGAGIGFTEHKLLFETDQFQNELARLGAGAARVPVLTVGDLVIWDSLAIIEYAAETWPAHTVWPRDARLRAHARSMCAEMHSGFGALRNAMGMNIEADLPGGLWTHDVRRDIDRIVALWEQALAGTPGTGPFLFGAFSAADAFFAPVVSRFRTYHVALPPASRAYQQAVLEHPAMKEWIADALQEKVYVAMDEPYRATR